MESSLILNPDFGLTDLTIWKLECIFQTGMGELRHLEG
jgi:hypothetical protein